VRGVTIRDLGGRPKVTIRRGANLVLKETSHFDKAQLSNGTVALKTAKISFANFKTSFASNVSTIRRRLSSGELNTEDKEEDVEALLARYQSGGPEEDEVDRDRANSGLSNEANQDGAAPGRKTSGSAGGVAPGQTSKTISAPTSPLKEKKGAGFFGKMSNFSQVVSAKVEQAKDVAGNIRVPGFNKDRCFTLLVIDDANTDWSKYFRGRRVHGDWDIRVEQAEFSELTVSANAEHGVMASIVMAKTGNKVVRSFRPDFLLVRQNLRDAKDDYRNLLLGFKYGNIPSVNSLESIYQFQDKPWVFANMIMVQQKLGRDQFPLIDQTYYPNHIEMVSD